LHPFDPEAVLFYLDPVLMSSSQPSSQESWYAKTLSNTKEVDKQTTLIKQRLEGHQSSSPTPIVEALNQLSKGAQVMAASTALLQAQITTLQKANKAMHVRRKRTRKALVSDTALSVGKVQDMGGYEEVEAEIREEMLRLKKRTSRCSKCG
jgi:type VI protein secretion system component VasK